jgi:cyclophilin family peptidyl-prolyl cis-trans isomerase/HEAT repeat protein
MYISVMNLKPMRKALFILVSLFILSACQYIPTKRETAPVAVNKFSDNKLQRIHTLQDERDTKELLPYLHHPNNIYRKEAALAFASVQDTTAIIPLITLLADTSMVIRNAAAYAIGQTGAKSTEVSLIQHINTEKRPQVIAELLEALGKVATTRGAAFLASYKAQTSESMAGQAWGLYRAGLRQVYTTQGIEKTVQLLTSLTSPYEARLAAAHFLARIPRIDLTPYRQQILSVATLDRSPEIRMAITQSLSKVRAVDKAEFLSKIAQTDPDYRVRLSAIRAMAGLNFADIRNAVLAGLQDENINVAVATAEFLQANTVNTDPTALQQLLPRIQDARVRAGMISAILKKSSYKNTLSNTYKQQYQTARTPYEKGHLLKGLAGDPNNYQFIADATFAAEEPTITTAGMEALIAIRQMPDFPKERENEFAAIFGKAILSGDVALVGMAASAIRDPNLNLRTYYSNISFMKQAQDKLVLPRDMETYIELQKTLDYLNEKSEGTAPKNPFTHPIDWKLVQTIPAKQRAVIRTLKGNIVLELFVEDAPGSVVNFVELVKTDFYDGLYFHRVVPNFVAQGGDKRGDGWGSSDYAIRSEFAPLNFREGYVGMASAGKDTESNQWFITHSPTPHLDGRYTIFAKVIQGMDIVHQLEVGDKIIAIELQ